MLPSFTDVPVDTAVWGIPQHRLHVRVYHSEKPEISGNKAFKLKLWMESAPPGVPILSFGGAFSNHLLALSAAAGTRSIGIVRGERPSQLNPWLQRMQENGMQLHFVQRQVFSAFRDNPALVFKDFHEAWLIPEGGAGIAGAQGAAFMGTALSGYDAVALAGGTGTTAAGILLADEAAHCEIHCFQVLKGEGYLQREIAAMLAEGSTAQLQVHDQYHFGGYAKRNQALADFKSNWERITGIELDWVYGAKAMYGLIQHLSTVGEGKRWLYLHSGGLGPNPVSAG